MENQFRKKRNKMDNYYRYKGQEIPVFESKLYWKFLIFRFFPIPIMSIFVIIFFNLFEVSWYAPLVWIIFVVYISYLVVRRKHRIIKNFSKKEYRNYFKKVIDLNIKIKSGRNPNGIGVHESSNTELSPMKFASEIDFSRSSDPSSQAYYITGPGNPFNHS